jgi:hypothetical protein
VPPELYEQVADHLWSNTQLLAACGLASRQWLPASRRHLYEMVALDPSNANLFLDLVVSPHCTILPFIHQLSLEEGWGRYSCEEKWLSIGIPRTQGSRIPSLRNMTWEALGPEAQKDLLTTFEGLTELEIHYADFETFRHFVFVLCAFPKLKCILFNEVECHTRSVSLSQRRYVNLTGCVRSPIPAFRRTSPELGNVNPDDC